MNFRRLKYFVKIVDIGSLTQAAEVLHIAQPALSQQVATLEGELDQQLLIRTKRGVTPTEAGKVLYTHARTILRQCEQAQLAVNNVGQTLSGSVSIGLAPGTAASPLPHGGCGPGVIPDFLIVKQSKRKPVAGTARIHPAGRGATASSRAVAVSARVRSCACRSALGWRARSRTAA